MLIDPAIRDWVMIPLLILVVLSMYLRNYGMKYLAESKTMDNDEFTQRNLVSRSNRLRANYGYISYNGFRMRQLYLSNTDNGKLRENVKSKQMNPMGQMDMLKQQLVMMGTQIGLGIFTQTFTSGFIALQLPFRLTERFKSMTQAGIGVGNALDTTYVSSTSWYMMSAFGIPRLLQLFSSGSNGSGTANETAAMQMQMGMMMPGMGGGGQPQVWNGKASYTQELTVLDLVEWSPAPLLHAENELLKEARELRSRSNNMDKGSKTSDKKKD